MANLLQLIQIEKNAEKINHKHNDLLKINEEIINTCNKTRKLLGDIPEYEKKALDKIIKNVSFREKYWKENRSLPKSMLEVKTTLGTIADNYTAIASLPQVKLSNLRELANILKMVIIPLEYTEIDKLFETQKNKNELEIKFNNFKNILERDRTTEYQTYLLCPIDYYSIWERIKSDVIKDVYYGDYFESIAMTLEMMIPTQKNLYLNIKTNEKNIGNISESFNRNIDSLNTQIHRISSKINKTENDLLMQQMQLLEQQNQINQINYRQNRLENNLNKQKNEIEKQKKAIKMQQNEINSLYNDRQELENQLKQAKIDKAQEIEQMYRDLDPILFGVEKNININTDEYNAIVGLCWGADIDDNYLKLKGLGIKNTNIRTANPMDTIPNISCIKEMLN